MKSPDLTPKQILKSEDVNIVSFMPQLLPTPVGSMQQVIWGLGSDDLIYQYISKDKNWVLAQ